MEGLGWAIGCVGRIMRSIASWERESLIVGFGRRDGGMGGRMGGVIDLHLVILCIWDQCALGG